jgi:solute carrier family 25 (adenine nucleotide translocator) protein 4/5/6/31
MSDFDKPLLINRGFLKPLVFGAVASSVGQSLSFPLELYVAPNAAPVSFGETLVRVVPVTALSFAIKDYYRFVLSPMNPKEYPVFSAIGNVLTGFVAGGTAFAVVYPFTLARARTLYETEAELVTFNKVRQHASFIVQREGLRGLYLGLGHSWPGVAVYRGFYFGIFDTLKGYFADPKCNPDGFLKTWIFAQISATSAAVLGLTPFGNLRNKVALQSGETLKYRNLQEAALALYKEEGVFSFFKNSKANLVRSVGGALTLVVYSMLTGGRDFAFPEY